MIKNILRGVANRHSTTLSFREQMKKSEGGFTLVELLITVVIIAILTAIAVPAYISVVTNAQDSAAKQTISSVLSAQDLYFSGAGDNRTSVAIGQFATTLDTATASPNAADLKSTGLLSVPTATRPSVGHSFQAAGATVAVVWVAVKGENGRIWLASTASQSPQLTTTAPASNAVGLAAYTAANSPAVD